MGVDELLLDLKTGLGMVRVNATVELGKLRDKRAEPALLDALRDENMAVRNNAAFALGELCSRTAVPGLIALLNDKEERVRKSAVKALGMIKAAECVAPLIHLLETETSHVVQKSAIRSLGQISGPKALDAVGPFVSHPDATLSLTAKKAIEMMSKQ